MPRDHDRTLIQFLVAVAFMVMMAIFNWIKNRSQSQEHTDTNSERKDPPQPRASPGPADSARIPKEARPRKIDWEGELRRMLEGTTATPPPLPPKPLPAEPTHVPPRPVITLPPIQRPTPTPIRPAQVEQERGLPVALPGLTTSTPTYARASQLDERVAEHLREITKQVEQHKMVQQENPLPFEVTQALALVRSREGLRSAILASVILGPPKAMEV